MVVFDFDGTIAGSMLEIKNIYNDFAKEFGYEEVRDEDIDTLRKKGAMEAARKLKIPFLRIPFLLFEGRKKFKRQLGKIKLIDGIGSAIRKLKKKNYKLAIISTNSEENVRQFIKKNNIDVFDIIYSESSLFGKSKVIKRFLKKTNLDSSKIVYIGDEIRDVEAAHKNNVKIIAVAWGFNSYEGLKASKPDFLINFPNELIPLID